MITKNRCECGNMLDPAVDGPDATKCEWCEFPEPPMYVITKMDGLVRLFFVNGGDQNKICFGNEFVAAYAPSKNAARAIFKDFMEGDRNVSGSDQD
jgi:hypothetical protein